MRERAKFQFRPGTPSLLNFGLEKKSFFISKLAEVVKFYAKPGEKCLQNGRVTKVIEALKLMWKLNRTKVFHFYSKGTKFMGDSKSMPVKNTPTFRPGMVSKKETSGPFILAQTLIIHLKWIHFMNTKENDNFNNTR
jgi:hypothetical protein